MSTAERMAVARQELVAAADRILINATLIAQLLDKVEPLPLRVQINNRLRTILDEVVSLTGVKV